MEIHFKGVPDYKPKVNLFFNHYINETRQHEIDECLEKNRLVFDRVIIVPGRPTFSELFNLSKEFPDDINCYCNSDIYYDASTIHLMHRIKKDECYAVTREDLRHTNEARGSQDAWIFRGAIKPINAEFTMGLWGCDNHIAHLIKQAGYSVKNPCLSIKIIHLHKVDNRDYKRTPKNTVPPPYLLLDPKEI